MSLRVIWRTLSRAPVESVALIAMIAVGIAAATMTFALVDAALIRTPAFVDAHRIVVVNSTHRAPQRSESIERWSFPRIQALREHTGSFESLASVSGASVTYSSSDHVEQLRAEFVSSPYFTTLGVRRAAIGRLFVPADDNRASPAPVTVISHGLWTTRFTADSDIVGRNVRINGHVLTVVGVAPPAFRGLSDRAELWIPETLAPLISFPGHLTTDENFISVVARLKEHADLTEANRELQAAARKVFAMHPMADADSAMVSSATARTLNEARVVPSTRKALLLLTAAIALLYLLALTNAVNLMMGRLASREHELSVRRALGASTRRLVHLLAVQHTVPVAIGGLAGLVIAALVWRFMPSPDALWTGTSSYGAIGSFAQPHFGARTSLFGLALVAVTASVCSAFPAMLLRDADLSRKLQSSGRAVSQRTVSLRSPGVRGVIVTVEAALAMMLLVAAGLMIDSFSRMRSTDLGINVRNLVIFDLRVPDSRVTTDEAPLFLRRVLAAIERLPFVVSASVDGEPPVTGTASSMLFIAGRSIPSDGAAPRVRRHYVAPAHFRTLGISLLRGREFTYDDGAGRPRVVIISANAAARFWPDQDPIGQRVWFSSGASTSPETSAEIIGIVNDVAYDPLHSDPFQPDFFTPYAQFTYPSRTFFVRTSVPPAVALRDIRDAVRSVEPAIPVLNAQSMEARVGASWQRQRFDAFLFGAFGVTALLLAATGIYAVVAHEVAQRTREMGIRLALGATPNRVLLLVVREGLALPLVGLTAGLGGAFASGQLIAASLYEVTPTDPRVIMSTALVLLIVSTVACLGPAFRAARVSPSVAMTEG